jgi:hypothetical protein
MSQKKPQTSQKPPQGGLMLEVGVGADIAGQIMTESQIKKG